MSESRTMPELPPDTRPLVHQVAGHFYGRSKTKFGLLERCSTGDVLKPLLNPPRGPREHKFYETMFSQSISPTLLALRSFLPHYSGTYKHSNMTYLILENIIGKYEKPCVIDIKLGRITYDEEATPEKIERQINKFQPAAEIGFQLLGWKVYSSTDNSYTYHDKQCARSLTKDELIYGMANFFNANNNDDDEYDHRVIVRLVIKRLTDLYEIMSKQYEFKFIASSILIVYDGDKNSLRNVDVRLVDFAHVFPLKTRNENDENFLFGLKHCIEYLQCLIDKHFLPKTISKLDHTNNCSASTCMKTFL